MPILKSIVYTSTALMPVTDEALEGLLIESRALNLESGVTGVLLCSDGAFMQCFEGTAVAVEQTWERIQRSRRHRSLYELMNQEINLCSFPDWQMGFKRATGSELLSLSSARWRGMSEQASSGQALGFQLLQQFWSNTR